MKPSPEHNLIFNSVKSELNRLTDLSELTKNAIATQVAIALRNLVRVKERDE